MYLLNLHHDYDQWRVHNIMCHLTLLHLPWKTMNAFQPLLHGVGAITPHNVLLCYTESLQGEFLQDNSPIGQASEEAMKVLVQIKRKHECYIISHQCDSLCFCGCGAGSRQMGMHIKVIRTLMIQYACVACDSQDSQHT